MNVGSLFSGAGLLDCGLSLAGLEHAWFCEADAFRRRLLERRFPCVPIYPDIRDLGAHAARVDVIAGGFPCRGASAAGKRNGMEHPETALWREMWRVCRALRPRFILMENVSNILAVRQGRAWGEVLGDLAEGGYDAVWDCLSAAAVGAPHRRDRVFLVAADTDGARSERLGSFGVESHGRPNARGGAGATANASWNRPARTTARRGSNGQPAGPRAHATADANSKRREESDCPIAGEAAGSRAAGGGAIVTDTARRPSGGFASDPAQRLAAELGRGDGIVGWGKYSAAIERWEAVHGPAPAPLTGVRGLDDGNAELLRLRRRVDRSRLSALGDGVQVQIGQMMGEYLMEVIMHATS